MRSYLDGLVAKTSRYHGVIVVLLGALLPIGLLGIGSLGLLGALASQFFVLPLLMLVLARGIFALTIALAIFTVVACVLYSPIIGLILAMSLGLAGYSLGLCVWKPDSGPAELAQTTRQRRKIAFTSRGDNGLFLPVFAGMFATLLLLVGLVMLAVPGGIVGFSQTVIGNIADSLKDPVIDGLLKTGNIALIMPGFATSSALMILIANALIADWLMCVFHPEYQRKLRFWNQELPDWYRLVVAVLVLAGGYPSILGRELVMNVLIALYLPGLLTGIGTIHSLLGRTTLMFYALWSVFVVPVGVAVAAFGILAKPLGLRRPSSS